MSIQTEGQAEAGFVPAFVLADRLRKAREHVGLDQGPFAEEIGVSRSTVSNYESGATTRVKPIVLKAWALRTGVSLQWLQTGETKNPRPEGPDGGESCAILDSNQEPID